MFDNFGNMEFSLRNDQLFNNADFTVKQEEPQSLPPFMPHQMGNPLAHSLGLSPSGFNSNWGGQSPNSDVGGYSNLGGFSSPNNPSGGFCNSSGSPSYFLSSAADTLNNFGPAAYNQDCSDGINALLDTTLGSSIGGSPPYPSHITPASTPAPSDMEILPEEHSLQMIENLSLQGNIAHNTSYISLPDYQNSTNVYSNSSPAHTVQNDMSLFPPSYSNSTQSHYNPQFQNLPSSDNFHPSDSVLESINTDDLLNIAEDYNIREIISNEGLANSQNGPSSLGCPAPSVPNDPNLWKKEDIKNWISWAKSDFSLSGRITPDMLPSTGKELCKLSKQQLQQRLGESDGESMAKHLNCLLEAHGKSLPEMKPNIDPYELYGETCARLCMPGSSQIQLWQFLLELLISRKYEKIITWENTNSEFKILEPDEVARLWGIKKTKPNMNYDKLSRALRYYYDRQLMHKVTGKRYAYKVSFPNLELLHANQHGSEPRPTPDIALFKALSGNSPTRFDTPSPRHS